MGRVILQYVKECVGAPQGGWGQQLQLTWARRQRQKPEQSLHLEGLKGAVKCPSADSQVWPVCLYR